MGEMIERVARAIGDSYDGDVNPVDTPNSWARALSAARAAIEAMREPTPQMRAAVREAGGFDAYTATDNTDAIIAALIDEALR